MDKLIITFFLIISSISLSAQEKLMSPEIYDIWNRMEQVRISSNGEWVSYTIAPGKGDKTLVLYNTLSGNEIRYKRSHSPQFDYDNRFIAFKTSLANDSLQSLKLKKVKKDKLPQDTITIVSLNESVVDKIAEVENYAMPKKSGSLIALSLKGQTVKKDSTLSKDHNSNNGRPLLVYDFKLDTFYKFDYVKDYKWSEKSNRLLLHSTGIDSANVDVITIYDFELKKKQELCTQKGKYFDLSINDDGNQVAFLIDKDTTKTKPRHYELFHWTEGQKLAKRIADDNLPFINENWQISTHSNLTFSENGKRLYYNIAPIPMTEDTSVVEDDKAVVEVWHYEDPLLYTMQNVRAKREKERTYKVIYDIKKRSHYQLNDTTNPELNIDPKNSSDYIISYNERPYQKDISWKGYAYKDLYLDNISKKSKQKIATKINGRPSLSPHGKYITWYSSEDTTWVSYDIKNRKLNILTKGGFYNEEDDRPTFPNRSGPIEWVGKDKHVLLYDQYDLWITNPNGKTSPTKLTSGRDTKTQYRLIKVDREITHYPSDTTLLLKSFNTITKESGYAYINLETKKLSPIESGPYNYTTRITKAEKSDKLLFTKENFQLFPNLILTDSSFKNQKVITDINPQQSEYLWGDIQLVKWNSKEGKEKTGLLVTPKGFDPNKKYPMMVNFYEKSSNRLYNHRAPYPHRSTINYTYWANKGYVIFNPDVDYTEGEPGKNAFDAVVDGVNAMIERGFVDESKIGLQGHSWGGYQIAHIITKTDMFRCAEAGAPVVNMVSAYGGIRWGSGMSRMFQYERTQSRLGTTLWENPKRYLDNSPIFNVDKINTPVLILHNDKDGAVPWYQGIEFFVALRRLNKPAWLLNYNNEPHWPVKRANRIDFNIRLEQFFDHYLMDKPIPVWMAKGIPAIEKGINYGLEIEDKN
jgi:dipeptidyl aminopeptidase/acylaminoacyl peptidase